MNSEPKPSLWKAWIVVAVLIAPFAWGFMAYTRVPKLLVAAIALALSFAAAQRVNDRVKQKYLMLALAVFCALATGTARADVTTGSISGIVSAVRWPNDPPEGPAAGARIHLVGRAYEGEAVADAKGFYVFLGVPPGRYVLDTNLGTLNPREWLICVHAGEHQHLNVQALKYPTHGVLWSYSYFIRERYLREFQPRQTAGPTMYSVMDNCPEH